MDPGIIVELRKLHLSAMWQLWLTSQLLTLVEKRGTLKGVRAEPKGEASNERFLNRVGAGRQLDLLQEYEEDEIRAVNG